MPKSIRPAGFSCPAGDGFSPSEISAVSAWLRAAPPDTIVTGSGISSLADALGGSPATQGTDANRPPRGAGNIIQWTNDSLVYPLQNLINNQLTSGGVAGWLRSPLSAATLRCIWSPILAAGLASESRLQLSINSVEGLRLDVWHDAANIRRASTANSVIGDNVWTFVTFEPDLTLATEADQILITVNATPLALTFTNALGTPGAMPAAFLQPTGNGSLGNNAATTGTGPFTGDWGPNIYFLNRQLTALERTNLMGFEVPA